MPYYFRVVISFYSQNVTVLYSVRARYRKEGLLNLVPRILETRLGLTQFDTEANTGRRALTRIIDTSQNLTYHTEFFSKAINHSSVNFGNGIEKV